MGTEIPTRSTESARAMRGQRVTPRNTAVAGGFYLAMGGIHVGIVSANTETYRHFADGALVGFVRSGWSEVFMAHPAAWGLLLAAGELALGTMLLSGGAAARSGWVAVAAFQVLLMPFGWGFWLWSVPALAVVWLAARRDWATLR